MKCLLTETCKWLLLNITLCDQCGLWGKLPLPLTWNCLHPSTRQLFQMRSYFVAQGKRVPLLPCRSMYTRYSVRENSLLYSSNTESLEASLERPWPYYWALIFTWHNLERQSRGFGGRADWNRRFLKAFELVLLGILPPLCAHFHFETGKNPSTSSKGNLPA